MPTLPADLLKVWQDLATPPGAGSHKHWTVCRLAAGQRVIELYISRLFP